jgi:transcriptional regulator with XRE-family HTH domain
MLSICHYSSRLLGVVSNSNSSVCFYIGLIIRRLREMKGISQGDLSKGSSANLSYISSIENHPSNISINKLIQICNAMGVRSEQVIRMIETDSHRHGLKNQLSHNWHDRHHASQASLRIADVD